MNGDYHLFRSCAIEIWATLIKSSALVPKKPLSEYERETCEEIYALCTHGGRSKVGQWNSLGSHEYHKNGQTSSLPYACVTGLPAFLRFRDCGNSEVKPFPESQIVSLQLFLKLDILSNGSHSSTKSVVNVSYKHAIVVPLPSLNFVLMHEKYISCGRGTANSRENEHFKLLFE